MTRLNTDVIFKIMIHKNNILELKNVFDSPLFLDLIDIEMIVDDLYDRREITRREFNRFYSLGEQDCIDKEDVSDVLMKIEKEMKKRRLFT